MGTVPMLCPYKMMFSGLIPYLAEDRAAQCQAHRQEIQLRGYSALVSASTGLLAACGVCPPDLPPAPHGWARGSSLHSQRTRKQPGLSCQVSSGWCQGFPSPQVRVIGCSQTLDCSRVGQPQLWVTLQARPEKKEAERGMGLHPKSGRGITAEPGSETGSTACTKFMPRNIPAPQIPQSLPLQFSNHSFLSQAAQGSPSERFPVFQTAGAQGFAEGSRALLPAPLTVCAAPAMQRRCRSRGSAPRACPCSRRSPSSHRRRCCN